VTRLNEYDVVVEKAYVHRGSKVSNPLYILYILWCNGGIKPTGENRSTRRRLPMFPPHISHRLFWVVCTFVQFIIPTVTRISRPQPRYGVGFNPSHGSLVYMLKPNKPWPTKYETELKRFKHTSNKCDETPHYFIPLHSHDTCILTSVLPPLSRIILGFHMRTKCTNNQNLYCLNGDVFINTSPVCT